MKATRNAAYLNQRGAGENERRGEDRARTTTPLHRPQKPIVHGDVDQQQQQVLRNPKEVEEQARTEQQRDAVPRRKRPDQRVSTTRKKIRNG